MYSRRLVIGLLICFATKSSAQIGGSWIFDNYAGINAAAYNPALPGSFPLTWDFNVASTEFFFTNNYGYIQNGGVLPLYRERQNLYVRYQEDLEELIRDIDFIFDFYDGKQKRFGEWQTRTLGPSFSVKINDRNRIGFFSGVRTVLGAGRVPANLSYYDYISRPVREEIFISPFNAAFMAWAEIGVNFNHKITMPDESAWTLGLNVKSLQGLEGAYFSLNENASLTRIASDTLLGSPADLSFGYTSSFIESLPRPRFEINGRSIGIDLGVTFTSATTNPDKLYDYKIGVALTDVGAVRFKRNAVEHSIYSDQSAYLAWDRYRSFSGTESLDRIIRTFSEDLLNDPDASESASDFQIFLPTTLNLSADFCLRPLLFINADLSIPISLSNNQPLTVARFAVTPRFEHQWFGVYVPTVIHNWKDLNAGAVLRLGYFIAGTDNLSGLLGESEFRSADIYFGLKINSFSLSFLQNKRRRLLKNIKCYKF